MSKNKTQWLFCYWDEPEFNYIPINKKMKNQVVVPVGMKLLIKEIKPETKTKSGLYLPEIALKQTFQGKVVGRGDEVTEIQIGDVVQYAEHAMPTPMKHQGEDHLLLQVGDVYAIIRYE